MQMAKAAARVKGRTRPGPAEEFGEGGEVGRPARESEAGDQVSVVMKSAENLVVTVDEHNCTQGEAHDEKREGLQAIEVAHVVPPAERKIDYSSRSKEASQTRPSVACALSGQAPGCARLPWIPFGFARAGSSPRKGRLLRMTIKLSYAPKQK